MRVTLAAVNAALRSEGIAAELVRGRGYFYFDGAAFDRAPTTSVMVVRLGQIPTVEGWVREARELLAKIPPRAPRRLAGGKLPRKTIDALARLPWGTRIAEDDR